MIKSYFKLATRNIFQNSFFILINIVGLAIAMAIAITAYVSCKFHWDWDTSHSKSDEIYKINVTHNVQGYQQEHSITPLTLAHKIKNNITGVDNVIRFQSNLSLFKVQNELFSQPIGYVDENFLDVFDFHLRDGDKNALYEKGGILISEKMANLTFGNKNPIGEVIILVENDKKYPLTVRGILENIPLNSSFNFEALISIEDYFDIWDIDMTSWNYFTAATFLQVKNPERLTYIEKHLNNYINEQNEGYKDWKISGFYTEPFKNIAKTGRYIQSNYLKVSFSPAAIVVSITMSIFILLIACFNFVNTSISILGKRIKEIGIRKIFGGHRKEIIFHFFLENFIICGLSLLLGLIFTHYLLPLYESIITEGAINFTLTFNDNAPLWIFLFLLILFTSIIAGIYPVLHVSKYSPVNIFDSRYKLSTKKAVSNILLTVQFILSIISIIIGSIFLQNAYFQDNFDLGYNDKDLVVVNLNNSNNFNLLKNEIVSNNDVISFSGSKQHIGYNAPSFVITYLNQKNEVDVYEVGENYLETMGIQLLKGRTFTESNRNSDIKENAIIVNEKFIRDFGLTDVINNRVYMNDSIQMNIIGVIKNVYINGTATLLRPVAFKIIDENQYRYLVVRSVDGTINHYLKEKWSFIEPDILYTSSYQEDIALNQKRLNNSLVKMFMFFALIALILSLIGLYAQVSLTCLRRTKELGIRTVLGATVINNILVINKNFIRILVISAIAGCILGYLLGISIIESIFTYYTQINLLTFILPVFFIFILAGITVSGKVYVTASKNPVHSLRYE